MNRNNPCAAEAFITLLQRKRNFFAAVAAEGPVESRALAEQYLQDTIRIIETCISECPETPPDPAPDNETLLSLRHFNRHIDRAGDPACAGPGLLRDEDYRFTEDGILLLTELWSTAKTLPCRTAIRKLLDSEKRKLLRIIEERESVGHPPL